MLSSLGIAGCGMSPSSPPDEVTATEQQEQGIIPVMLPVNVKIELKAGGRGDHELLGFNPETRQVQLAGLSQGLPLTEVAKIERDRQKNQGSIVRGRPNIRGEDMVTPETWRVPFSAIDSKEEKRMMIRGQQAWDNDEFQGKLELQNDYEFVLDQIIPLSADEMEIVVSKVPRDGEE